MIDPRFASAGAVPVVPGYGTQQAVVNHRRHHRHHRKHKHGLTGEAPVTRDESIHKVDHGQPQYQQNAVTPFGTGYGVPYGVGGLYPQQQYPTTNYGFGNQYQGTAYDQGQTNTAAVKKHRRHHRHHHHHHKHAAEPSDAPVQPQEAPEVLIGQRSSSVLRNEVLQEQEGRSSVSPGVEEVKETKGSQRKSRRQQSGEHFSSGKIYHSRQVQGLVSGGAEGYGRINENLIFIERSENSPHRQNPPPGYELKGKIEVECMEKESRSQSRGRGTVIPVPPAPPVVPPAPPAGPCPPGWQQVVLSAAPCGVASSGYGGFGGVGSFGGSVSGGGLANLASCFPFPPQGQLIADYIVEPSGGGASSSGCGGFTTNQYSEQTQEQVTTRAKIIEVWQKRDTSEKPRKPSSDSDSTSPKQQTSTFDFEKFRKEILEAIKRIMQSDSRKTSIQENNNNGTQTHIDIKSDDGKKVIPAPNTGGGEVRVIVQPIQPVFYMPRQVEKEEQSERKQVIIDQKVTPGPIPPTPSGPPQIVYVPRNVYVPVIKPVFVPKERVIVRPQIIHVARPVLVDRPVPVTQRPIIIDRERPIPVPVRCKQEAAQGGSKVIREEYVYRDNLPVAYGGRCSEYAGGVNYGYMPTQQEHQYASSNIQEESQYFQQQEPVINVAAQNQFQNFEPAGQLNVQQGGTSIAESYTNVGQVHSASAFEGVTSNCTAPIEVLDTTVCPTWQRTDKETLFRRFGRSAADIVQKTDQVEQQMYQELRQRTTSGGIQRSHSAASYGSGSGIINGNAGGFLATNASVGAFPVVPNRY